MTSFTYLGYEFIPYGNIIGKDNETRFQRLIWRTNTARPLLDKGGGYNYDEFYHAAKGTEADIYFVPEAKGYYVPTGGGICSIDFQEMKKYIKKI